MTMTDERLAELDAVMANTTKREWSADGLRDNRIVWSGPDTRVCFMAIYPKAHADSLAIVALHNAYPDLRAHIEAQAATIARLVDALRTAEAFIPDHGEGVGHTEPSDKMFAQMLVDYNKSAAAVGCVIAYFLGQDLFR